MEEDFKKIGLIPNNSLTEEDGNPSKEPYKARNVPSPDPSTLPGLDDSEGNKSAKSDGAKQPKPKMSPSDDADYDVDEDGGSEGAGKKGSGSAKVVQGSKEASLKGEAKEMLKKMVLKADPQGKYKKAKAKNPEVNKVITKGGHPAMEDEEILDRAAAMIEEVEELLSTIAEREELNNLIKGFKLVSENAANLADNLVDMADEYEVEDTIEALEGLAVDAAEVAEVFESVDLEELDMEDDEEDMEEGAEAYKPRTVKTAKMKKAEDLFRAMVTTLMDALEAYDATIDEEEATEESGEEVAEEEATEGEEVAESEEEVEETEEVAEAKDEEDDEEDDEDDDDEDEGEKEDDDEEEDDKEDDDEEDDDKEDKKEESVVDTFNAIKKALSEGKKKLKMKGDPKSC